MAEDTGIDRALAAAGGGPEAYKRIAELLGTSLNFVYLSKRRGYFPPERARMISDAYGIPLTDLVSAKLRPLLNS